MYRSAEDTACLLATLLHRSGQKRARISSATVRKIAGRTNLRSSFIVYLQDALAEDFDWILFELKSGGFGAIQSSAIEAAKSVTGMKYFTAEERKQIDRSTIDVNALRVEIEPEGEKEDVEDE